MGVVYPAGPRFSLRGPAGYMILLLRPAGPPPIVVLFTLLYIILLYVRAARAGFPQVSCVTAIIVSDSVLCECSHESRYIFFGYNESKFFSRNHKHLTFFFFYNQVYNSNFSCADNLCTKNNFL